MISIPKGFTNDKGKNPKNAWKWLQENYSAIANHLKPFKEACEKRQDKGDFWWELRACDYYEEFGKPKIMIPDIALSMQALYDDKNFYCVNTAYIIPVNDKFLLGILNSNLVQYYYSKISSSIQGGYFRFIRQYLETIPISRNVKLKIEIEKLVNQLLQLNQQNSEAKLSTQVSQIQGKIDFFENRLNQMVYQLYDLTEEEIKIVEGNG